MINKIIAVDFDGTLCEDKFPEIGEPNNLLIAFIQRFHSLGVKIILWTCRNGSALEEAVSWCKENGVPLDAVNENLPEVKEKYGGDTRKVFADLYLDDKNITEESIKTWVLKNAGEIHNRQSTEVAE